jgi:GWxTD domain-containing protein
MRKLLFLSIAGVLAATELLAQAITPGSSFVLNVDYSRFRNDDRSGYLEVYYGFYPSLLTYEWSAGKYRAGVILSTRLISRETNETVLARRSLLRVEESDTSGVWYRYPFVTQAGFAVPFGEYTLEVIAADSLADSRKDSVSMPIEISRYPATLAISDLELSKNIKPSNRKDDLFYKNSLEVVPNPSLVFGVATSPVIFNYIELYNLDPDQVYTVKTEVIDGSGKVLRETSKPRKYRVTDAVEVGTTMITSVPSGTYLLRFLVVDQDSVELARTERKFYVYNPHLETALTAAVSAKKQELQTLSAEQLDAEFRQARYIATDEEAKIFEQLDNEEGKRNFLARFWVDVEKGRLGWVGVTRAEYLRRVAIANELYSSLSKEGWRTDRGRVYILYGRPEEIERFPSLGETKPYQIWRYFRIENGVEFVFVDRTGYGDFELVHSTKRGELRDDGWRRFLR